MLSANLLNVPTSLLFLRRSYLRTAAILPGATNTAGTVRLSPTTSFDGGHGDSTWSSKPKLSKHFQTAESHTRRLEINGGSTIPRVLTSSSCTGPIPHRQDKSLSNYPVCPARSRGHCSRPLRSQAAVSVTVVVSASWSAICKNKSVGELLASKVFSRYWAL